MKSIPFQAKFMPLINAGKKTMTTRNKKYGESGDYLIATSHGEKIYLRLISVSRVDLDNVATVYYREEGCQSPLEFIEIWNDIHPIKGFQGSQKVWLHSFQVRR